MDIKEKQRGPSSKKLALFPENPEPSSLHKGRFPSWLRTEIPKGDALGQTNQILRKHKLNTVCEEAKCPNRMECYSKKTATFLALGKACTRACGFCEIDFDKSPLLPDETEPMRIAGSVKDLGLKHVVITMVARDDLPDQGASHIASIIRTIRKQCPATSTEILTSDFSGNTKALNTAISAEPEIFNHNIETVRRLSPRVRHKASYERTLSVLSYVKEKNRVPFIKSGIMVGLGETDKEVEETLADLHRAGCSIVTIGQYLQPSRRKLLVKRFVTPKQFEQYALFGKKLGIKHVYAGPFVRSSYNAAVLKTKAFSERH